tara:strand:+ start:697 stop:1470 length:774 start_codon:yes stop_codon:yes gene_type:complete
MKIIDTHTHLYAESFDEDREEVIKRAIFLGIDRFFIPAIDSSYTNRMLELKNSFPENIFLMSGLHPCHVKENYKEELEHVDNLLQSNQTYFAIGEIGIDLYWKKNFLDNQKQAFEYQINLAKKYSLPIVIHCRDAFDEVFEILESNYSDNLTGIFHCFSGTLEQAKRIIDLNMKLGIGGVVTFKNGMIDQFLNQIPLNNIVLETDSPYLAPSPYRGKRNESSYIIQVIKKLSEVYEISSEEISKETTKNAKQIFKIK